MIAPVSESEVIAERQATWTEVTDRSWRRKTGNSLSMIESFYHAFHGIWVGLTEERNLRIHFLSLAAVIVAGVWLHLDLGSWLVLCLAIGLVLVAEFLNTALEHLVDLSSEGKYYKSARYAKDTSAAAVLCASVTAAAVGCLVFGPRLAAVLKLF